MRKFCGVAWLLLPLLMTREDKGVDWPQKARQTSDILLRECWVKFQGDYWYSIANH